jgi:predicted kinase
MMHIALRVDFHSVGRSGVVIRITDCLCLGHLFFGAVELNSVKIQRTRQSKKRVSSYALQECAADPDWTSALSRPGVELYRNNMLILVAGLPGSGKSFFSENLARRIGAVYLSSDRVRVEMQASGKYAPEDKLAVYKRMIEYASVEIEAGRNVVIDATFFHHTLREMFVRLAEGYAIPLRVIEITADEALVRKRLSRPRRWSDADYTVYETIRDQFEEIVMPHTTLISTDTNIESMLEQAIRYINI